MAKKKAAVVPAKAGIHKANGRDVQYDVERRQDVVRMRAERDELPQYEQGDEQPCARKPTSSYTHTCRT